MADTRLTRAAARPAPDPSRIRAELDRARDDVAAALLGLRDQVQATISPREWVRRHPLPMLVGALLVGVWLGRR